LPYFFLEHQKPLVVKVKRVLLDGVFQKIFSLKKKYVGDLRRKSDVIIMK
jgi:hypothetical protein